MPALVAMRVPRACLPRLDPVPLPARPSPHRSGQGHDAAQSPCAPPNLAADVPALPASRPGAFSGTVLAMPPPARPGTPHARNERHRCGDRADVE